MIFKVAFEENQVMSGHQGLSSVATDCLNSRTRVFDQLSLATDQNALFERATA